MTKNKFNPISWVPTLYFAMGLPFVVLNMVSVLMFKGLGNSDREIAFWTSLIMLPWTLKPLWSPFLELYKNKKFFVVLTQLMGGLIFGLVALSLYTNYYFAISIALMFLIAFSGATHDIAADGVYISSLDNEAQAKYIGWQGAFYNLAKVIATGGLVYFAGYLIEQIGAVNAWAVVISICSLLLVGFGFYHIKFLPGGEKSNETGSWQEAMQRLGDVLKSFFLKKHIWIYIAFIILYRFAEGYAIKIVPLFLKADVALGGLGLTEKEIGLYYGTFGAVAFLLGSVLGGYYISYRKGLSRALFTLCCAFNLPFIVYLLLAVYQPSSGFWVSAAIITEYFGYGFGFVGLMLFMMQQIAPGPHQMSHYAFATGIMNLGVMIPGMMSGYLSDWLGYQGFFIWVLVATIPAFLITYLVPFTYPDKIESK